MSQNAVETTIVPNLGQELAAKLKIVKSAEEGYISIDGADVIGHIGEDYISFSLNGEQFDEYPSNYLNAESFLQAVDYLIRYGITNYENAVEVDENHVIGTDVPEAR